MNPLTSLHCQPLEGHGPMGAEDIAQYVATAPGWALVDGAIQKQFEFADYHRTIAFVNALAWVAHNPQVSTVITGASKLSQLQSNLGALDVLGKLTPEVIVRIDAATLALAN